MAAVRARGPEEEIFVAHRHSRRIVRMNELPVRGRIKDPQRGQHTTHSRPLANETSSCPSPGTRIDGVSLIPSWVCARSRARHPRKNESSPRRALVIDDDHDVLAVLVELLDEEGCRVHACARIPEGAIDSHC
jgi:hypothetical protein